MFYSSVVVFGILVWKIVAVLGGCVVEQPQCYVDTSNVLGVDNMNWLDANYNEWCAQICYNDGWSLAGTEAGYQCFCGNSLRDGTKLAPMSDCSTACPGSPILNETCGGDQRILVFKVDCDGGTPVPPPAGRETPFMVNPCLEDKFATLPFCNYTLSIDERVKDALSRMSRDEKIGNLVTLTVETPSLGLPAYDWWSEATHGVGSARVDDKIAHMTNFAFPITTAMSFNRSLWHVTGAQIGREARALMNVGSAYSTFWAPVVNLARDPRWGRNIETPGEDPYLSGEYATYFVRGFQESPDDSTHLQASACCKHYVANEMESSTVAGVHHYREEFNATVSMQDLVDSYMFPFQACVEKGRVTGLMCSFNAVNGVPSCANSWLLTTIARQEWGFDGYISGDCEADQDVWAQHHYTATPEEAVAAVLHAGTDIDCGWFVSKYAQPALDAGLITESDLDARLYNLLRVRMRLGHFDPPSALQSIGPDQVCSDDAIQLAEDGTAQGVTLVKNVKATLPLNLLSLESIAVIGPNALLSQTMAQYYGPFHVCNHHLWTMVDAVQTYLPADHTKYAAGVNNVTTNDRSMIPAAVDLAKQVDQVILVVGTDLTVATEGLDAPTITLSDAQLDLIEQVSAAASKPVIVVSLTAVPLDLTPLLTNSNVGAIIHAGQPSVTQRGIAHIIFGTKSPAGRLVQTIYPASYASEISIFDFNMRPGPSAWPRPDCPAPYTGCVNGTNPGRTYRFYIGTPVLPFGYGMSYTTFTYSLAVQPAANADLSQVKTFLQHMQRVDRLFFPHSEYVNSPGLASLLTVTGEPVQYAVNVSNTGLVDADDVVLGFYVPPAAGQNGIPLTVLFGFERVHVRAGETVTVWLYPGMIDFTVVDDNGHRQVNAGQYRFQFGVAETQVHGMGYAETVLTAV